MSGQNKKLKKCRTEWGHYLSNGGRVYYVTAYPPKTNKQIHRITKKTDTAGYDSSMYTKMTEEIKSVIEPMGYQVDAAGIEKRVQIYKLI